MSVNEFDEKALTWDEDPKKVRRARAVADTIREHVPLRPNTRLLEFGAGTGQVTQGLREHVGAVTLADSSAGMLDVLRQKQAAGVFGEGARVWDLDLSGASVPDEQFDLIVTVLALHHIVDVDPVLRGFAALLAPGGVLCVVDLEEDADGSFHGEGFQGHDGFTHDVMIGHLEQAGFMGVEFTPCGAVEKPQGTYPMFLATCRLAG